MKKFYAILCLAIASLTQLQAQAPQGFNYQATVRNSAGDLIVNTNVYFKFNVMQGSQTSLPVFTEIHYVPTDDLGQVNLVIGQGTATTGAFSELDWSLGSYYLGIELDTGNSYVAMGTTQLLSVPYALYAENSGNATSAIPNLEAVLAENNSANNQQIKDLQDPTDAQDAVTKGYIDAQIAEAVAGLQNQIDDLESDSNINLNLVGSWYGTSVDNSQPPTTEEIQIILESDGEGHTIFDRYDQDNNLILEREYDVTWSSTANAITINYFDYGPNGQQYIDSQTNSYEFIDTDSVRFIEDDGDVTILYRGIVNPEPPTIVDIAVATPDLSNLVAALQAADGDLVTTLNGGEYTLLAPTNAAFETFLSVNGFSSLDDVPTDVLANILLNHVITGEVRSTDLSAFGAGYASTNATNADGDNLSLYFDTLSGVVFNGVSSVSSADIVASNGIVHVVDAVIGLPTIATFASSNDAFSTLVDALAYADTGSPTIPWIATVSDSSAGPFTLFAPSNDAFIEFYNEVNVSGIYQIVTTVIDAILLTHVVSGNIQSSGLPNGTVTTLGADITFSLTPSPQLTDPNERVSNIVHVDIQAVNGVIHTIDKVILPQF
jgi:uncharacterized surface protein with fasciclin (FAS1) repeats